MSEADTPTAKAIYRVSGEVGSAEVQTLWAYALGQDRYRLANSPVGFGTHTYPLAGGKEGDISLYGAAGYPEAEQTLSKVGKHRRGKGCLYIRRLADVDLKVLEQLVACALRTKSG